MYEILCHMLLPLLSRNIDTILLTEAESWANLRGLKQIQGRTQVS